MITASELIRAISLFLLPESKHESLLNKIGNLEYSEACTIVQDIFDACIKDCKDSAAGPADENDSLTSSCLMTCRSDILMASWRACYGISDLDEGQFRAMVYNIYSRAITGIEHLLNFLNTFRSVEVLDDVWGPMNDKRPFPAPGRPGRTVLLSGVMTDTSGITQASPVAAAPSLAPTTPGS